MARRGPPPHSHIDPNWQLTLGFKGACTVLIASRDAVRTGAKTLSLKLILHEGMLVGRILATDAKTVVLPYILSLNRAPA
jgi:hypothetical protein